ncbi:hypothetical protein K490DRAFT_39840 [Saccharata proteae CBS 121410]|uniref:ABM domain-containing protein n=1 Tax=Saccharata proteae CBS 121410 TaxID=1314787 RepID=A0A9P4LZX3_9PEZI|nr:hypothetical protein K490DRAFT_39840 [Saccharata proteae CBS 121410]
MAPVTEVALLPLPAGSTVDDPSTDAGQVWQDSLNTVMGVDGAERAYWSREVENPTMLRLFVDWKSLQHHKTFIADKAYGPFVKHLLSILDGGPQLYHVEFQPHPPKPLSQTIAPATEVLTMFFPASLSTADQESVTENMKKLGSAIEDSKPEGFRGISGGWVVEELDNEKVGGKAKAFMAVIGWASIDAHMQFRETDEFKSNIYLVRDAPHLKDMKMVHVESKEVQGPLGGTQIVQDEVLNPQAGEKKPPSTRSDGTSTKFERRD